LIEGRGFEPDIAVADDPVRLDVDAQLDAAIDALTASLSPASLR
jgi:hypothetical protein